MSLARGGTLRFRREGDVPRCRRLLLLADESEAMVARYLPRGELWVAEHGEALCAVAVLTDEGRGLCELKNLAVAPECQRQGIGRRFVAFLREHYATRFREMRVGTGETPRTLGFYRACGFRPFGRLRDFFTEHYAAPIVDDGVLLRDMVLLHLPLSPGATQRDRGMRGGRLAGTMHSAAKESLSSKD